MAPIHINSRSVDGIYIQILLIPHNFHIPRPFDLKPCIAGGNFGSMSINLCTIAILLAKHIPSRHRLLNQSFASPFTEVTRLPCHSSRHLLRCRKHSVASSPPFSPYFASAALSAAWSRITLSSFSSEVAVHRSAFLLFIWIAHQYSLDSILRYSAISISFVQNAISLFKWSKPSCNHSCSPALPRCLSYQVGIHRWLLPHSTHTRI